MRHNYNKPIMFFLQLFKTAILSILLPTSALAKPLTLFVHPSDRVIANSNYLVQAQALEDVNDTNMVNRQAELGSNVVLWLGKDKTVATLERAPRLMQLARQHTNIGWVYLYDEMFWDKYAGISIGQYEVEILQGADMAHAAGLKTIVTILPDVILSDTFKLNNINAFDGISIDVYPSIRPTVPNLKGCSAMLNSYTADLFYCSVQKLRTLGFTGKIGLLYQGFILANLPREVSIKHLMDQRVMVNNAEALGAYIVSPWGLYLGAPELAAEPYLVPLGGTDLEILVSP